MTSYITITDAETDPSAPLTSELAKKWRDNPIALAEGAAGAPRSYIGSLERLTAGTSVRAVLTNSTSSGSTSSLVVDSPAGFIQGGTLRTVLTYGGTASSKTNKITRVRAGVTTVLVSTTTNPITTDITVLPGDLFTFSATGSTGPSGGTLSISASLQTNGEDLHPSYGLYGLVTGNRALT